MNAVHNDIKIDQIIRSKRRTISVEVKRDGSLIVRAPIITSRGQIDELVGGGAEEPAYAGIRAAADVGPEQVVQGVSVPDRPVDDLLDEAAVPLGEIRRGTGEALVGKAPARAHLVEDLRDDATRRDADRVLVHGLALVPLGRVERLHPGGRQ